MRQSPIFMVFIPEIISFGSVGDYIVAIFQLNIYLVFWLG